MPEKESVQGCKTTESWQCWVVQAKPHHCKIRRHPRWQIVHTENWLTYLALLEESQALFEEVTYLGSSFEDSISFKIGCTVSLKSFWNRKQWDRVWASPERPQFDKTPRKHKGQLRLHEAHWGGSISIQQQQQCVLVWEIAHFLTHTKIHTTHLRNVSNLWLSPLFPWLTGSSADPCRGRLDSVID